VREAVVDGRNTMMGGGRIDLRKTGGWRGRQKRKTRTYQGSGDGK
jgi:hypothetical protein